MTTTHTTPLHGDGDKLSVILDEIAHYLPSQGPLTTFVHHNTLHHLEHLEFFDALDVAADMYGATTGLLESQYQAFLEQGRITYSDINKVLAEYGYDGQPWMGNISTRKIARSLLFSASLPLTAETLRWRLIEKRYLERFHDEVTPAKIQHIRKSDAEVPEGTLFAWLDEYQSLVGAWNQQWLDQLVKPQELKHNPATSWSTQDSVKLLWIAAIIISREVLSLNPDYGVNHHPIPQNSQSEEIVNPYLIKFTSSFLDTGLAHLSQFDRTHGLLDAFFIHMENSSVLRPTWLRGDIRRFRGVTAEQVIVNILAEKGIEGEAVRRFLLRKALILKGWAGLIHQSERGVAGIPSTATLAEFLAVRLILEDLAERYLEAHPHVKNDAQGDRPFELNRPGVADVQDEGSRIRTTAYHLFHAFQLLPWGGSQLLGMELERRRELVRLINEFDSPRRIRVWQKAYEWSLYTKAATALLCNNRDRKWRDDSRTPECQLVCCIDDREESFRRYVEEINQNYETFGTAGFFGVDAEFHSLYERPASFCPVNVVATHHVEARPRSGSEGKVLGVQKLHTWWSDLDMFVQSHSRSLVKGWLLALGGLAALLPLSLSTLAPRMTHQFRIFLKRILLNPADESAIIFAEVDDPVGEGRFTLDEMAHRVRTLLVSTGLSRRLAPIVVIMGHGSYSTNNPFRSAYDCGACGGRPGRMNPRVFAMMANRRDVRQKLRDDGLDIPEATVFIGAFHNTCTDEVEYFDTQELSDSNARLFTRFKSDIELARAQNALERCRRFDDSRVTTLQDAIAHVESRAHHIAQPRPEYGHATNALCVVGRRALTRGLFFDRRAFLVSYDREVDQDCATLRNLLRAVVPVCMGINLEYFFSAIDNQRYGAGTKLPHNVTSLLGLMTGYCSDLRTGLPAQMVEIHEPVRLLLIIECEPEQFQTVLDAEPELAKVVKNQWVRLMLYAEQGNRLYHLDHKGEFALFEDTGPDLKVVSSSLSWAIGKREHLDFVRIN